jgi:hypothetical protein
MNNNRSLLLVVAAGALTACGGGGGSDNPSASDNAVSLDQQYVATAEAVDVAVPGSFGGHRDVRVVSENRTQVRVSISDDGSSLVIRPLEVDRPKTLNLSLVFGDDPAASPVSLTVYVQNTSSTDIEQQVTDLLAQRDALVALEQERVLYQYFLDIAYLRGEISDSRKRELIEAFQPSASANYASLRQAFTELRENSTDYQKGALPDYRLRESLDEVMTELDSHSGFGSRKLEDISDYTGLVASGFNQSLTNSTPEYSQTGVYSRFLSTAFGRFEGDEFVLDPAYRPLESMIRSDKQQEIVCETI